MTPLSAIAMAGSALSPGVVKISFHETPALIERFTETTVSPPRIAA